LVGFGQKACRAGTLLQSWCRIGNIGRLTGADIQELLNAVATVLRAMKVSLPVAPPL
jgi:aspartate aminotransferase-like enzyme